MDSSSYRDIIYIENQVDGGVNEFGTVIKTWDTVKRMAEATPLKGQLLLQAGQLANGLPYEFKLHYEKELKLTEESRIRFRDMVFTVHTAYDYNSDFTEWYVLGFGKRIHAVTVTPPLDKSLNQKLNYKL